MSFIALYSILGIFTITCAFCYNITLVSCDIFRTDSQPTKLTKILSTTTITHIHQDRHHQEIHSLHHSVLHSNTPGHVYCIDRNK